MYISVENGELYMKTLTKYVQEIGQGLKFDTVSAKAGYVSSFKLKNVVYGSEGMPIYP